MTRWNDGDAERYRAASRLANRGRNNRSDRVRQSTWPALGISHSRTGMATLPSVGTHVCRLEGARVGSLARLLAINHVSFAGGATRSLGCFLSDNLGLDVEAEVHDVAILDDVLLAFE